MMSEKRFTFNVNKYQIEKDEEYFAYLNVVDAHKIVKKLNEQQATIQSLQGDVNRLQYIIDELRKDNYKRFEKINELKAKLKEKEEDEKLYANEIVELRKTNEEWLEFKELGGDY